VKQFRETPFGRINAAAPFDGRKFFAMRDGGDFGGFGLGAMVAPQIIVIERLHIFVDGNDRRPSGVERYGFNFSAGNTGFLQRAMGSRGESAHVIRM
jgi:hypothetical protein